MNAEDIQRIEQLSQAAHSLPSMHIDAVLAPQGTTVVSLEHLAEHPARLRQTFKTQRISDFVAYVNSAQGKNKPTVYVSRRGNEASAIIDHGDEKLPGWGSHCAELTSVKTCGFQALETLCAKPRSQSELIDYLEDWAAEGVECLVSGEGVSASAAIAAVRRVELKSSASSAHAQDNFVASRTALEQIEARGAVNALPEYIKLIAPVYVGTKKRDILARVSVRETDGKPAFIIRLMQFDALLENVAREVEDALVSAFSAEVSVFVGYVIRQ
jgi:uncharacterized protein YfdQ (DUF2303 family)